MKFIFSTIFFIIFATGSGGLAAMYYRQSLIKKLKGEKTISFFDRIKVIYFFIKKYINSLNNYFTKNRFYEEITNYLKIMNYEDKIKKEEFLFLQEIFCFAFFLLFLLILDNIFLTMILCVTGFYFPVLILKIKVRNKKEEILKEIPDALDLIAANIESGLSINKAIERYAMKNKNPFSEELQLVLQKMQFGKSFEDAMTEFNEKFAIKEVFSFTNSLIQAVKTGGNIKKIIKGQAEELRKKRFQFLKKKAYEAPVKLLIPLILFIFPVIFIVLFGPIIIKIFNGF